MFMNCSNSSQFYLGVAGTVACIAGAAFLGTQWAGLDLAVRVGSTTAISIALIACIAVTLKQREASLQADSIDDDLTIDYRAKELHVTLTDQASWTHFTENTLPRLQALDNLRIVNVDANELTQHTLNALHSIVSERVINTRILNLNRKARGFLEEKGWTSLPGGKFMPATAEYPPPQNL